jgi:hypothetical protein
MTTSDPSALPGWYPDPYDPSQLRYWDGAVWTESVSPGSPPAAGPWAPGPADPSGLGDVGVWLGDTFRSMVSHAVPLAVLLLIVPLAGTSLVLVLARAAVADVRIFDSGRIEGFDLANLLPAVAMSVLVGLVSASCWLAAYHLMVGGHAGGQPSVVDSLAEGLKRLPLAILWWLVHVVAWLVGVGLVFAVPVVLAVLVDPRLFLLVFPLGLLMVPLVVWIWVRLTFVTPALAAEQPWPNPVSASWRLTADRFWAVLGRVLLLTVLLWGLSFVGQIVLQVVSLAGTEVLFGVEADPVSGELLIDGQRLSDLEVVALDDVLPGAPAMIVAIAIYWMVQAPIRATQVSAVTGLYVRARARQTGTG